MAFCELRFFSKALRKATAANIVLPEDAHSGPYPVMYLLHGLSDDHTIWERRTSVERYVQNLPLILVMPDGERGWYTDAVDGAAYETALMTDLIGYVDRMLPTRSGRAGRCIGGLSMGGYGALKLALKHPDMFCSATSHSGAPAFAHRAIAADPASREFQRIFGPDPAGGPEDCFALAESVDRELCPALSIDCGVDDFLIQDNRLFHDHLQTVGLPHEYAEYAGAHDWAYWDQHIQEAIQFHARCLGID